MKVSNSIQRCRVFKILDFKKIMQEKKRQIFPTSKHSINVNTTSLIPVLILDLFVFQNSAQKLLLSISTAKKGKTVINAFKPNRILCVSNRNALPMRADNFCRSVISLACATAHWQMSKQTFNAMIWMQDKGGQNVPNRKYDLSKLVLHHAFLIFTPNHLILLLSDTTTTICFCDQTKIENGNAMI